MGTIIMATSSRLFGSALLTICIIAYASTQETDTIVPEAEMAEQDTLYEQQVKEYNDMDVDYLVQVEDMASWTYCAKEHHHCKFSGKARVKYGAKNKYAYKTKTGGVHCGNGVFGDPIRGTAKKCYYQKIAKKVAKKKKVVAKRGCKCLGREMAVDASTAAFLAAMTSSVQTTVGAEPSAEAKTVHDAELTEVLLKGTKCEQWSGSTGTKWCTVSSSCKAATGVVNNMKINGKCLPFCHSAGFKVPAKMKCATSDHVVSVKEKAKKEKSKKEAKKKEVKRKESSAKEKHKKAEKASKEKNSKRYSKRYHLAPPGAHCDYGSPAPQSDCAKAVAAMAYRSGKTPGRSSTVVCKGAQCSQKGSWIYVP